jgi:SecD/SecF fusion protein
MKNHSYRAVLIWVVIIAALINIYPTVGWMLSDDDAKEAKITAWDTEDQERAKTKHGMIDSALFNVKRWSQFDVSRVITLGLDLQGGIHMVISVDHENLDAEKLEEYKKNEWDPADIQAQVQRTALEQIRRRVNDFEAKEPIIQALGADQIQIQLPGEKDLDRARDLITKAAVLDFHLVAGFDESKQIFRDIEKAFPGELSAFVVEGEYGLFPLRVPVDNYDQVAAILKKVHDKEGLLPEDKFLKFSQKPKEYEKQFYKIYILDVEPLVSGEGLVESGALPDDERPPYWQITFRMNAAAGAEMGKATSENLERAMAILLDNVVVSAPTIQGRITTNGQITGSFEDIEARDLSIALNSGSMAVKPHEEFTRVVGPTLGAESIRQGVTSAVVGIMIVGLFMMVYYMAAGIISVLVLVLNAVLIIAAMAYFDMTLTLPGIAGLILTIGMAVDANVLIYERIREELNLGHSLLSSIENGFSRASVTILDANVTTLIAAVVLFQFGTGPIEGFAVTLSIGVCSSVFTALVVSRALLDFVVAKKLISEMKMLHIIKAGGTKIPFMQGRQVAAIASILFIVVGMSIFTIRGKENLGVDFTQGTNITLHLTAENDIPAHDLRAALEAADFDNPQVQTLGDETASVKNQFTIRVRDITTSEELEANESLITVAERIKTACAPLSQKVTIEDEQTVGPAVGKQLSKDAVKAMLFALIFIVIYLTLRFELRFAVGAVVALSHDVLVTLGVFALLGKQIDMNVVAALLTIIGYSLNDTIVVYDRIREDMTLYRGKGYKFLDILDLALNSTLSRTLLTSLTTLFVVVVLFIFGGRVIQDFAFALILGVLVGTYSSIFIASPVVYAWQRFQGRHVLPTDTGKNGKGKAAANA